MSVMSGGIDSGFRKVTTEEYKPRLLQVQRNGKQTRTMELDEAVIGSLNNGDCFILDAGSKIYVYHGDHADGFERHHATSAAEKMESDRGDGAERVDVDESFWEILGGTHEDVSEDSTVAKPDDWTSPLLFSFHDDTKQWDKVKEGQLTADDIRDDDVMMIDCGEELFVMVSRSARTFSCCSRNKVSNRRTVTVSHLKCEKKSSRVRQKLMFSRQVCLWRR